MFELHNFISEKVIKRKESMFSEDILANTNNLREKLENKTVLVIGGAGSIGSSFIKSVLKFKIKSLVVVDVNENGLAELTRDLRSSNEYNIPNEYITYPMDYSSQVFNKMFNRQKGFDIVANFSAHKHVRSEKDIYAVESLIRNNVINAKKLLDILCQFPPEEYFCVSTDKAANPVNIMGASKRIMEDLIFSYSNYFPVKTARFANVAFSNGSLPDGFLHRINKLQPISAPYDVKRYFVSPEESGQICMLSCVLGENREIFFPKLEEAQMMSFDVIATELLKTFGYDLIHCQTEREAIDKALELRNGSKNYPVYFTESNTSGEKAFEEFYIETEKIDLGRMTALGVITGKEIPNRLKIKELIDRFNIAFEDEKLSKEMIVGIIKSYLPNFEHIEIGKSLDSKM